jgi:hypothetical protein
LSSRSIFTDREAVAIADKLDATIDEGRKHTRATVTLNGQYVGSYGIRRGTSLNHDYIPRQIHATTRQAIDLARCPLTKEGFVALLEQNGFIRRPNQN